MEKVIQLLELEKSTLNDLIKYESADYHDLQMIAEIDQALQLIQSCVVGRSEQLADFCKKVSNQKDCPEEFQEIVNKEFWNLIS